MIVQYMGQHMGLQATWNCLVADPQITSSILCCNAASSGLAVLFVAPGTPGSCSRPGMFEVAALRLVTPQGKCGGLL